MLKTWWQHTPNRQHVFCLLTLLLISLVYFNPLLRGRVVQAGDVINAAGMQENINQYRKTHGGEEAYWSTSMFSGMPAETISIHYQGNIMPYIYKASTLGVNFIVPYMFYGMALFYALLCALGVRGWLAAAGGVAYGFFSYYSMIVEAGHVNKFGALMIAPGVFWAVVRGYQASTWRGRLWAALLLAFMLGLEVYLNHVQMTYYLLFVVLCYIVYVLYAAVRSGAIRAFATSSAVLATGAVVAVMMNAVPLLPMYEYSKFTIRGPSELSEPKVTDDNTKTGGLDRDYAFGWSYGREEMLTLLVPNAVGGSTNGPLSTSSEVYKLLSSQNMVQDPRAAIQNMPTYWGQQSFTNGPFYVGAIVVFLFILGALLVDGGMKWALVYGTLLSLLLALGQHSYSLWTGLGMLALPLLYALTQPRLQALPQHAYAIAIGLGGYLLLAMLDGPHDSQYRLTDFFMDYVPLYNKFRVPSSMLIMVALTMPLLGLLGVQALLDDKKSKAEKLQALYYSAGFTGGLCLLLAVGAGALFDFTGAVDAQLSQWPKELKAALVADRESLLQADALRSVFFIALAALVCFLAVRGSIKAHVVGIVMLVLIAADMWVVNRRILNEASYTRQNKYAENFAPRQVDQMLKQDTSYYRVFPIGRNPFNDGYTPYFHNSIGGYNAAKLRRYQQLIEKHLQGMNPAVVNMLNTKYLIHNQEIKSPLYTKVFSSPEGEVIYLNRGNYGPAWLVQDVRVVATADKALDTLGRIDTYSYAVVEQSQQNKLGSYAKDTIDYAKEQIKLTQHDNRRLTYSYESPKARFVVFSEVYYPKGWTATIDGQPAEIVQTNFVLRGLVVPAGKHTIHFEYYPTAIAQSETLASIGSGLFVLGLLAMLGLVLVQRRRTEA